MARLHLIVEGQTEQVFAAQRPDSPSSWKGSLSFEATTRGARKEERACASGRITVLCAVSERHVVRRLKEDQEQ